VAKITIHLDDELLAQTKRAAEAAGTSVNRWIAEAIIYRVKTEWPASMVALAGAWPDFPTQDQIRKQTECSR
jgi:predicted transcriptional regulator